MRKLKNKNQSIDYWLRVSAYFEYISIVYSVYIVYSLTGKGFKH